MDPKELMLLAIRATIIYFFVLLVVRLMGKREIGNIGPLDLIVTMIIGESVDEAIYGDVTIWKGLLLIGTIAAWHVINSWASHKSRTIERITEAKPSVLVEHGHIKEDELAKQRMSKEDLFSELRIQSISKDEINEVACATLEPSGHVSVLKEDWAKPIQKKDLPEKEPAGSSGG